MGSDLHHQQHPADNHLLSRETIVNRRIRPGVGNTPSYPATGTSPASPIPGATQAYADNVFVETPNNASRTVAEFDFDKNDLLMSPRSLMSDSIRDLPGDDIWTSPSPQMIVSPIHPGSRNRQNTVVVNPGLMVPTMIHPLSNEKVEPTLQRQPPVPDVQRVTSHDNNLQLEGALMDAQTSHSSIVEEKQMELYYNFSPLSKALRMRLLPLMLTFLIELPAMFLIAHSGRLCHLLGGQHYHRLMSFLPLIAAISGNLGLQSSQLTTSAILNGKITTSTLKDWVRDECLVSVFLGACVGVAMGMMAFVMFAQETTRGTDLVFAWVIGIAQAISSISAGVSGAMSPVALAWVFQHHGWCRSYKMDGLLERALQDVMTALLILTISSGIFVVFVAINGPLSSDGCVA